MKSKKKEQERRYVYTIEQSKEKRPLERKNAAGTEERFRGLQSELLEISLNKGQDTSGVVSRGH